MAYHHGDLRRELLRASIEIIRTEGLESLSLRKVAQAAGVSHAAPYAHFADKAELIAAVKEEGFLELERRLLEAAPAKLRSARSRLLEMGSAYLRFAVERPTQFEMMFHHPLRSLPPGYGYVETGQRIFALMEDAFRAHTGWPRSRARRAAFAGWSLIHGAISLWIGGPLPFVYPEAATPEGLLKEGERLVSLVLGRILETREKGRRPNHYERRPPIVT